MGNDFASEAYHGVPEPFIYDTPASQWAPCPPVANQALATPVFSSPVHAAQHCAKGEGAHA
jgi:hypothetical protein